MTNRSLEIFVAVAECENMSLAARKLFITQSSVSQVVSEIEREHGVLLFDRLSKSLHLTEVGRAMLLYAKRILALQRLSDSGACNVRGSVWGGCNGFCLLAQKKVEQEIGIKKTFRNSERSFLFSVVYDLGVLSQE